MPQAPSIIDIARRARVSKSTAARALAGSGSVRPATRSRVLEAAQRLKYRANSAARTLRRGQSRVLGVVVPDVASPGFLSHAISAQKLEGLARAAGRLDYDLQIFVHDLNDAEGLGRMAVERSVRAFFFLGRVPRSLLDHLEAYHVPWVALNWQHRDGGHESCVWTDFEHAGRVMAAHLLDVGCRRVLAFDWLSESYGPFGEGILRALPERGLAPPVISVRSGRKYFGALETELEMERAFVCRSVPDGLLLGSLPAAMAAYRWLRARSIEPGRQVALAVFDDMDPSPLLDPPLTAYAQDTVGMGEAAVREMDRLLARSRRRRPVLALPGRLNVRASTERFRGR